MKHEVFKSDRYFVLFDAMISHGQLLLRSQKNEIVPYNIDIIFFDTAYLQISSKLKGVCIRKVAITDTIIQYIDVNKYLSYDSTNLFELESDDTQYYIVASFVRIFENTLEFDETSLGYENKGREKEIAAG